MKLDTLIVHARVVTCAGPRADPLGVIEDGAIGIVGNKIAFVGRADDVSTHNAAHVIDAGGNCALPGLVDPHTHLVFAGSRIDEFARKMAGEDYRAIAAAGGGIASTVGRTRGATDDALFASAKARAWAMRRHGTTSLEIKSGYGLSTAHELRLLRIGRKLADEQIVHTTTTLLGAHAIAPEYRGEREKYIREVVCEMIAEAQRLGLADACDVYMDDGAFTLAEGRFVLEAARNAGLRVRGHVGQFTDIGGAELLAELGALSADHLEVVSDRGVRALADAGVVAVLLPGAWRTLRQSPPDVARFRADGVRMAIGTDCNPGSSPCTDLPLCAALAVRDAGVTTEEAIIGITANAARAAGLPDRGRLAVGLRADIALFAFDDPRVMTYGLGDVVAETVLLDGRIVDISPLRASLW